MTRLIVYDGCGLHRPRWIGQHDGVILGIDEAGRGPVLGPLVVAGVVLKPQAASALTRRGVTDSKDFGASEEGREKRAELARHVHRLARSVEVIVSSHDEVDRYTDYGLLNELERRSAVTIIEKVQKGGAVKRIVADGEKVFGPLRNRYGHFEARDFGEQFHVAVAAASVVAKDVRDRLFHAIAARYDDEFGPVRGGGYVNAATADFLRRYHARYQRLPDETRRSFRWKVLLELEPRRLPLFDGAP